MKRSYSIGVLKCLHFKSAFPLNVTITLEVFVTESYYVAQHGLKLMVLPLLSLARYFSSFLHALTFILNKSFV